MSLDKARRIVFTGAAGGIGTMTRPLLARLYPGLMLSDLNRSDSQRDDRGQQGPYA